MDADRFADEIRSLVRETGRVELKGPGTGSDKHFMARVVRAVIAMANRRDGGVVVVGVEDNGTNLTWTGLTDDQLATWNSDHLRDRIGVYADPPPTIEVSTPNDNGRTFVVIDVSEFDDVPVICKKAYGDVLRDGALYVRSLRKPESVEPPTSADLRDLLGLATEKATRRLLATAERVGFVASQPPNSDNDARFRAEVKDLAT